LGELSIGPAYGAWSAAPVLGLLAYGWQLIARFEFIGGNQVADGFRDFQIKKRLRLSQLTPPVCSL